MSNVLIERDGAVVVARLNRPQALNALNTELMHELVDGLQPFDRARGVGCFVITGSDKVFAAGADIKEMRGQSYIDMFHADFFAGWEEVPDESYDNAFKAQWELFLKHVAGEGGFRWNLLEGAKGVQLAELGLKSWKQRKWLDVPALKP
jgi:enoyl-CoA hydratase/carnithine racemase